MRDGKYKILVVSIPSSSGGGLRALKSLEHYSKIFKTSLIVPSSEASILNSNDPLIMDGLKKLATENVRVVGHAYIRETTFDRILSKIFHTDFKGVKTLLLPESIRLININKHFLPPDLIMTLHENCETLNIAYKLSEIYDVKSLCLLQLPPFYYSRSRLKKIYFAYNLWFQALFMKNLRNYLKRYAKLSYKMFLDRLSSHKIKDTLKSISTVIAVSKAIPLEMGKEWMDKVIPLDPGVSLDKEDLELINTIENQTVMKRNHVVFGGRPVALKGLVEALIAFRGISKYNPNMKLIVTGVIDGQYLAKLLHFCRSLSIDKKVVFTGFLPREERLKIVSEAKLMLYPSHVDAFPYAVCESLLLGTPIVGYRIPALETYYGNTEGIKLVEEADIEALTTEAINVLENKICVVKPEIKSWDEIMDEEISLIKKTIEKS